MFHPEIPQTTAACNKKSTRTSPYKQLYPAIPEGTVSSSNHFANSSLPEHAVRSSLPSPVATSNCPALRPSSWQIKVPGALQHCHGRLRFRLGSTAPCGARSNGHSAVGARGCHKPRNVLQKEPILPAIRVVLLFFLARSAQVCGHPPVAYPSIEPAQTAASPTTGSIRCGASSRSARIPTMRPRSPYACGPGTTPKTEHRLRLCPCTRLQLDSSSWW